MNRTILAVFALILVVGGVIAWVIWRSEQGTNSFQGYVEGYYVYAAPETGGRIENLTVDSGSQVKAGQFVFQIEGSMQQAQRDQAAAQLQQAQSQLTNLQASLQRPEEIAVLQAQERSAQAQLTLSTNELQRQQTLFERGISAKTTFDQAKATNDRDKAALEAVQRQISAGRIAARTAEIQAAEANVKASQANLDQAETRLAKLKVYAPADGQVQDVFFRTGEVANAGQPVLSILPPGNRRIRFYVPEPKLSTIALGQVVGVACDNCQKGLTAKITFISHDAEFTPPVIFSLAERAKLVFRVEATPIGDYVLPVGQPVDVIPSEKRP
ncbi:HlyD family secretion protein [Microvirga terricola]|uniref:HlyD family efflux transporter periplasmic adaptor subunit n=1 Tax=Microvirga terricola TaxID=2719797 RepID=A0ABX0V7N6_9HYPH|nr:HlyD family efflux transporter periplasmic adaptor subunit [Microvirga terricola]NIX75588.1 HlyD family efflux transporter periplasmic adaptor subunit [Microvirga terricola]